MTQHPRLSVGTLLRDLDVDALWDAANGDEKRGLVAELVEAVIVHPDRLRVTINGAPPLRVDFDEVGLRPAGMRSMVSKGGGTDSHTGHWRLVG